jgi:hypothetical protein
VCLQIKHGRCTLLNTAASRTPYKRKTAVDLVLVYCQTRDGWSRTELATMELYKLLQILLDQPLNFALLIICKFCTKIALYLILQIGSDRVPLFLLILEPHDHFPLNLLI